MCGLATGLHAAWHAVSTPTRDDCVLKMSRRNRHKPTKRDVHFYMFAVMLTTHASLGLSVLIAS